MGRGVEITGLILIYNMAVRPTSPTLDSAATYGQTTPNTKLPALLQSIPTTT